MDSDPAHLKSIRNIGIIAHIDAGKTTTTERILYYTGEIHRMGDVDKGSTTTDYLEEERERGITIVAAAITCHWKDATGQPITINIIDTPGHVDFTAEVERSLRVLDGAIVVFSAVEGVEAQSETVWRQATKYHVPRLCFINKMDRIGAEFERVFAEIQERLESHPIPVQIPIGAGPEGTMGEFQGLIDLITMKALYYKTEDLGSTITETEIPDDLRPEAELWREKMLNALADFDEAFTEAYMAHLEGAELTEAQIVAALRRATLTGRRSRSSAARASSTSASSGCSTRSPPTCPARSTGPRSSATTPRRGPRSPASPTPTSRSAAWSSRSPTTSTATCRSSGSTRASSRRGAGSTTPARTRRRSARGSTTSAPTIARRSTRPRGRRHRRRRRPEGLGHRRHALRRRAPDPAGADRVPRDGHQHVDRAGQLGRQGEARRHPERAGARGPDVHLQGQRGDRPDAHLGHGRAAPGDPQEPDDPRLQPEGARRPAAGQLPRDDQARCQAGAGDVHPPDRRLGALRQGHHRPRARAAAQGGARAGVRQQAQGGRHPLGVPPGDRGGPARGGQVGGPHRLPAGRPEGDAGRRRHPRRRFQRPGLPLRRRPTHCARRSTRPGRSCSSRS